MPQGVIDPELTSPLLTAVFRRPTVVTWNRLEARPRTREFSRSLRAEVRDALWMLSRQWQVGEFKGEDAGSAVFTRVAVATTRLTRFAARDAAAVAFDEQPPLEVRVEREAVPPDVATRAELGQRWLDLLTAAGAGAASLDFFRAALAFPERPAPTLAEADLYSDRQGWRLRAALAGRGADGGPLLAHLLTGASAADFVHEGGTPPAADRDPIEAAQAQLLASYRRLFSQPADNDDPVWSPHQLEYRFACSAPERDGAPGGPQTVLVAEEYAQGHLDWYAFDVVSDPEATLPDKPGERVDDEVLDDEILTFLPSAIEFGGMPSPRWWEFEDRRTDLGDIDAETSDLAKLLLAEFTLLYSNDWMVIPYELPIGALCRVAGLVVVDTFGQRQVVRAAGHGDEEDGQRWKLFSLSTTAGEGPADGRLFLPPVVGSLQESEPVEEVRLFRDEMANMVWGVETRIPGDLGTGRDGFEAAQDLVTLLARLAPPAPPPPPAAATGVPVRYVAGTTVPENWIPFLPVHIAGSNRQIQLRRAALPRLIPGLPEDDVVPRGAILTPFGPEPYHVFEEEVPREGVVVTRSFQRTRGIDGETYLWLGRRKQIGRDSRSSGLRFDQVEELGSDE